MEIKNTLLDDIAYTIGFTPTSVLAAWHGGEQIYVPTDENKDDPLACLIGRQAFSRLVREYPGHVLAIPRNVIATRYARWRIVHDLILSGIGTGEISEMTKMTSANIHKIRRALEEKGMLPLILRKPKNAD